MRIPSAHLGMVLTLDTPRDTPNLVPRARFPFGQHQERFSTIHCKAPRASIDLALYKYLLLTVEGFAVQGTRMSKLIRTQAVACNDFFLLLLFHVPSGLFLAERGPSPNLYHQPALLSHIGDYFPLSSH